MNPEVLPCLLLSFTVVTLLFLLIVGVTGSPDETEGRCPEGPSVSGGLPVTAIARRVRNSKNSSGVRN